MLWIRETIVSISSLKPWIAKPFIEILETSIDPFDHILQYLRMDFFLKWCFCRGQIKFLLIVVYPFRFSPRKYIELFSEPIKFCLSFSLCKFFIIEFSACSKSSETVSYTHLRAHETRHDLVCRLL